MKTADWYELKTEDCKVLATDEQTMDGIKYISARISHSEIGRPKWFASTRSGNLVWSRANKPHENATAYIIKDGVELLHYPGLWLANSQ